MPGILGLVLERAIQSDEEIGHYVRNIWFAVTKIIEKRSHQGTLQGQIVMLVFSLVLVKRGFGQCKRLYLITTITLLVQIKGGN
jgi:hypothetical protein